MGQTPIHHLPFPEADDSPDGPVQIKALADATERELNVHDGQISKLAGVKVAYATSTAQRAGLLGWQILPVSVVIPASSARQYKIECQWQCVPSVGAIVHTKAGWRPGTQPSVTEGTIISWPQDTAATAAWHAVRRNISQPFLIPFDGTVCVFIVTSANAASGFINYGDVPNGDDPDYLSVYDIGPKP